MLSRNDCYVYCCSTADRHNDQEVMVRIVFVHGACVKDGSWWWHRTGELLTEQGLASEAPALPSCGETGEPTDAQGPVLAEDVEATCRRAEEAGGQVQRAPEVNPVGITFAHLLDPAGNHFAVFRPPFVQP